MFRDSSFDWIVFVHPKKSFQGPGWRGVDSSKDCGREPQLRGGLQTWRSSYLHSPKAPVLRLSFLGERAKL